MNEKLKKYTLAIMANGTHILLVEKSKPAWQQGLLNGPGGHIEPVESMRECIVREVKEETGLVCIPESFLEFGIMEGYASVKGERERKWVCQLYFRYTSLDEMAAATTQTPADLVSVVSIDLVKNNWSRLVDNIPLLYEMGAHAYRTSHLSGTRVSVKLEYNYK